MCQGARSKGPLKKIDFEDDVVLDTGSMFALIVNEDSICNVKCADQPIEMKTNARGCTIHQQGEVLGREAPAWCDNQRLHQL